MGRRKKLLGLVGLTLALGVPLALAQQGSAGFDGHIQSGTCANPDPDVHVDLKSDSGNDVKPYLAEGGDQVAYYGAPTAPGFGLAAAYDGQSFSLVITDPGSGDPVACGDILPADADRFRQAGIALVQLLPVEGAGTQVHGIASINRTALQRELDITPTVVRILMSEGAPPNASADSAGYDGYIQGGTCESPTDDIHVDLKSEEDHDVVPYLADPDSGEPVTLAYYGAPGAPGFGLAAAYTDEEFSLVITGDDGSPVACGDIQQAESDDFREAGMAVVQLSPVEGSEVQGYAIVGRSPLQRELDITPTRVRILLFAPPAT